MITVLSAIGIMVALCLVPVAVIFSFIGLWIAGHVGAVIGAFLGLVVQFSRS